MLSIAAPTIATTAAPEAEPLALDLLKQHLRIDHAHEDDLLGAYIASARAAVETITRLRLITQTVRLTYNDFPAVFRPPIGPVQSVSSIKYTDEAGVEQTIDPGDYELQTGGRQAVILPPYLGMWPTPRHHPGSVRVELVVGFGDEAADVPADLLAALRLLAADSERFRQNTLSATLNELPMGVRALLAPHVLAV